MPIRSACMPIRSACMPICSACMPISSACMQLMVHACKSLCMHANYDACNACMQILVHACKLCIMHVACMHILEGLFNLLIKIINCFVFLFFVSFVFSFMNACLPSGPGTAMMSSVSGWTRESTLAKRMALISNLVWQSRYFHVVGGLPPDAMHDILEGVLQYCVKLTLRVFVLEKKFFTADELNRRILMLDYGYQHDGNKPSTIQKTRIELHLTKKVEATW